MTIANDVETERELMNFQVHYGAFIPIRPFAVSKAMSVADTVVINVSSYIMDAKNDTTYISEELLAQVGV